MIDNSLPEFLEASGARVFPVTPYRYATDSEAAVVADAIGKMAAGQIDAIAFTRSPQIARLFDVAHEKGLEQQLAEGWKRTRVASIGPVVTEALKTIGVKVVAQPETAFHLKPLVGAIVRMFS